MHTNSLRQLEKHSPQHDPQLCKCVHLADLADFDNHVDHTQSYTRMFWIELIILVKNLVRVVGRNAQLAGAQRIDQRIDFKREFERSSNKGQKVALKVHNALIDFVFGQVGGPSHHGGDGLKARLFSQ